MTTDQNQFVRSWDEVTIQSVDIGGVSLNCAFCEGVLLLSIEQVCHATETSPERLKLFLDNYWSETPGIILFPHPEKPKVCMTPKAVTAYIESIKNWETTFMSPSGAELLLGAEVLAPSVDLPHTSIQITINENTSNGWKWVDGMELTELEFGSLDAAPLPPYLPEAVFSEMREEINAGLKVVHLDLYGHIY
jgi:hypothetical protein